uniref:Midkine n=2 Tax=Takifugu rubripes TaxID=31033 RepID=A0A6D2X3S3_TAKRU
MRVCARPRVFMDVEQQQLKAATEAEDSAAPPAAPLSSTPAAECPDAIPVGTGVRGCLFSLSRRSRRHIPTPDSCFRIMRSLLSVTLLLLLTLTLATEASRRVKGHRGGKSDKSKAVSECTPAETRYGKCVPESGDCGEGLREATCKDRTDKIHCKIPCNWKKDINDCKYKFGPWGPCDAATNTKSRSGTLKKVLFNADCQSSVKVSKPCSPKVKKGRDEKNKRDKKSN